MDGIDYSGYKRAGLIGKITVKNQECEIDTRVQGVHGSFSTSATTAR